MIDLPKYQKDYSLKKPILFDYEARKPKIDKMIMVLSNERILDNGQCKLAMDLGCSSGLFSESLAPYFEHVIGLDIDNHALIKAVKDSESNNVSYMTGDSMQLPLADSSVDFIICNHVYEHVPDPEVMFSEIYRVLDTGGVCYFGAASRLTFVEPHYNLVFLSWLPKWMAHYYMRLMGKGEFYYENLRTYWGIKKLINNFSIIDYTLSIVKDPEAFSARDLIPENSLIEKIPLFIWKLFYWFLPGYIFVLRKQEN